MAIMYFPLEGKNSVTCVVTSNFGRRAGSATVSSYHHGTDIAANRGDNIICAYTGVVKYNYGIGESGTRGNTIVISSQIEPYGEVWHYYQHMNERSSLQVGQSINVGDFIGHVGGSGGTSTSDYAPHLHFGLSIGGVSDYYRSTCERYDDYPAIQLGAVDPATATWLGIDNGEVVPFPDKPEPPDPPDPPDPPQPAFALLKTLYNIGGGMLLGVDTENNRFLYKQVAPNIYQVFY